MLSQTVLALSTSAIILSVNAQVFPPYDGQSNNFADGISTVDLLPNARNISNRIFSQRPFAFNKDKVSSLNAAWGQFMAHDMIKTFGHTPSEKMDVPLPRCDLQDTLCNGNEVLSVSRNAYDTSVPPTAARVPLNGATAYIDASTVYGQDSSRLVHLRTFAGGKLKADNVNGVPLNSAGVFMDSAGHVDVRDLRLGGDPRVNENPGLLAVHGLWVLEHNRLCDELAEANPSWNDARLFSEARKLVIAKIQHITATEYVPLLIGEPLPAYAGYNPNVNVASDIGFAAAAYRYGHSGINTQYWCFKESGAQCSVQSLLLRDNYMRADYLQDMSIADLLRGMVRQPESAVDTALVDDVRNHLLGLQQDLAAIDVMRCRDLGCAKYAQARAALGLGAVSRFSDITPDVRVQLALEEAYGGDVAKVDLWVGGLAEPHKHNAFVGPTFAAIIKQQYRNTRDGDRFWYENRASQPGNGGQPYLSDEELQLVRASNLQQVIKRNTDFQSCPPSPLRLPTQSRFFDPNPAPSSAPSSGGGDGSSSGLRTLSIASGISFAFPPVQPATASIDFHITMPSSTGWFAFGFGSTMVGSDMVTVEAAAGTVTVQDRHSSAYVAPVADAQQDVQLVSSQVDSSTGRLSVVLRRALSTGGQSDFVIPASGSGTTPMIFAWGTSSTMVYHASDRRQINVELHA